MLRSSHQTASLPLKETSDIIAEFALNDNYVSPPQCSYFELVSLLSNPVTSPPENRTMKLTLLLLLLPSLALSLPANENITPRDDVAGLAPPSYAECIFACNSAPDRARKLCDRFPKNLKGNILRRICWGFAEAVEHDSGKRACEAFCEWFENNLQQEGFWTISSERVINARDTLVLDMLGDVMRTFFGITLALRVHYLFPHIMDTRLFSRANPPSPKSETLSFFIKLGQPALIP